MIFLHCSGLHQKNIILAAVNRTGINESASVINDLATFPASVFCLIPAGFFPMAKQRSGYIFNICKG
jgi:hypothetical protein